MQVKLTLIFFFPCFVLRVKLIFHISNNSVCFLDGYIVCNCLVLRPLRWYLSTRFLCSCQLLFPLALGKRSKQYL